MSAKDAAELLIKSTDFELAAHGFLQRIDKAEPAIVTAVSKKIVILLSSESTCKSGLWFINTVVEMGLLSDFKRDLNSWVPALFQKTNSTLQTSAIKTLVALVSSCRSLVDFDHQKSVTQWASRIFTQILKILQSEPKATIISILEDLIQAFTTTAKPFKQQLETILINFFGTHPNLCEPVFRCLIALARIDSPQALLVKACDSFYFGFNEIQIMAGEQKEHLLSMDRFPSGSIELSPLLEYCKNMQKCISSFFRLSKAIEVDLSPLVQLLNAVYDFDFTISRRKDTYPAVLALESLVGTIDDLFITLCESVASFDGHELAQVALLSLKRTKFTKASGYKLMTKCLEQNMVDTQMLIALETTLKQDLGLLHQVLDVGHVSKKRKLDQEFVGTRCLQVEYELVKESLCAVEQLMRQKFNLDILKIVGEACVKFASHQPGTLEAKDRQMQAMPVIRQLFQTLASICLLKDGRVILPVGVHIFQKGYHYNDRQIRQISRRALLDLENCIHPICSPKQYVYPSLSPAVVEQVSVPMDHSHPATFSNPLSHSVSPSAPPTVTPVVISQAAPQPTIQTVSQPAVEADAPIIKPVEETVEKTVERKGFQLLPAKKTPEPTLILEEQDTASMIDKLAEREHVFKSNPTKTMEPNLFDARDEDSDMEMPDINIDSD
ncbi:hypothetical protein EDD86DRAFT_274793 [Gorgonomyces haynaldii]|nr:hypothetical protein EDD86DRAFT_274793 [Gorgonomyces haynaldii]